MRLLTLLGFCFLLSACVTSSSNYYTKTLKSWEGSDISSLEYTWGKPNTKIVNPNGHAVYIYRTQTYGTGPHPTQVGVNVSGTGRPLIVSPQNRNNPSNKNKLSLTCLAIFDANANGEIISTEVRGNGCYGSSQFANKMMNPAYKKNKMQ